MKNRITVAAVQLALVLSALWLAGWTWDDR